MDKQILEAVKANIKPLCFTEKAEYSAAIEEYFRYYGLDIGAGGKEHFLGYFVSGDHFLVGHVFIPPNPKGVVIAQHGYFGHCGIFNNLIRYLYDQGYCVAAFDLPGHGLSNGDRWNINSFQEYSQCLLDFFNIISEGFDGPYHFVGHSTGAAAVIETLLSAKQDPFDKIILAGPLVRCKWWSQTYVYEQLGIPKSVVAPRVFSKCTSDEAFMEFIKNDDPLQGNEIPLGWVDAMHRWNEKMAKTPVIRRPIKMIQGDLDTTVDWKYNLEFIKLNFGRVNLTLIEGARHELFNETEDMRTQALEAVGNYLEQP